MGNFMWNGNNVGAAANNATAINCTDADGNVSNVQDELNKVNENLEKVRTYVGTDGKLHFVDATGADSVLPFSNFDYNNLKKSGYGINISHTVEKDTDFFFYFSNVIMPYNSQRIFVNGVAVSSLSDAKITSVWNLDTGNGYGYGICLVCYKLKKGDVITNNNQAQHIVFY